MNPRGSAGSAPYRDELLDAALAQGPQQVAPGDSFLYPRWLLLAALWFAPAVVGGYLIEALMTVRGCPFGVLCAPVLSPDAWPGVVQVFFLWLAFAVVLFFARVYGRSRGLAGSEVERTTAFDRAMHELTATERARSLAWGVAALVGVGLIWAIYAGRLDGPTFGESVIVLVVGVRCATAARPRPPRADARGDSAEQQRHEATLGGEASFWHVLRNTPPVSWFARTGQE